MPTIDPLLVAGGAWIWQNYGKDTFSWLIKRLAKRTEDLKESGWEKIDWLLASQRYREELQRLYGTMHIFGMSHPVPLNDIFTDVYLLDKPNAWRRHAIEELHFPNQDSRNSSTNTQRYDGVGLVQEQRHLYILGQPGAGKTTFLKYLVMQAIEGKLQAIPIFVSMKIWSDSGTDLLSFLVRQFAICNFPNAQPFIEQILEDGHALVLFDGLDEVNLEKGARNQLTATVRDFFHQYNKSRVVITCRTAASEYIFEGFSYCELAEFTTDQMKLFVNYWFHGDETKYIQFWEAFGQSENARLYDLGSRPLLLTMLCLTFEETMSFPSRKAELYEEAIDALLKKWDVSRSIQRDKIYRNLSLGYKRQLLKEIAAESFERGELFIHKRDVIARINTFLRRLPLTDNEEDIDGEIVLRSIEEQHGLLVERANNIYSFSHLTFHEYFTARYIAEHPEPSILKNAVEHASDPRWGEVLILTASMLDHRNAKQLFEIWYKQLQILVQSDTDLTAFVQWVSRKNWAGNEFQDSSARATIMLMALIDFSFLRAFTFARSLSRALARVSVLALTLSSANNLASELVHDLVYDLALTLTRNFHSEIPSIRISTLARFGDRALRLTRQLALALSSAGVNAQVRKLTQSIIKELDLILNLINISASVRDLLFFNPVEFTRVDVTEIDDALVIDHNSSRMTLWYSILQCAECLALGGPASQEDANKLGYQYLVDILSQLEHEYKDSKTVKNIYAILPNDSKKYSEEWVAFVADLRDILLQNHDIGHRWQLGEAQLTIFSDYFLSTERLIQCLNVAIVENRELILSQVLTMPKLVITVNS